MNRQQMINIIEQYSRKSNRADQGIQITTLPDHKTIYVEQIAGTSDAIMLSEYQVDSKTFWAGFSWRSQTVYVSQG